MAVDGGSFTARSSRTPGLADLAQSWIHLARETAADVPELPAVIQQEVGLLSGVQITEERLIQVARVIAKRVHDAGFPNQATDLLHRMGRPIYEMLFLLATEEELRTARLLREATAGSGGQPRAAAPVAQRHGNGGVAATLRVAGDTGSPGLNPAAARPRPFEPAPEQPPAVTASWVARPPSSAAPTIPASGQPGAAAALPAQADAAEFAVPPPPTSGTAGTAVPRVVERQSGQEPAAAGARAGIPAAANVSVGAGWNERISPRAAEERARQAQERELLLQERARQVKDRQQLTQERLREMPALVAEIVAQALSQRRAVSNRGLARKAVRAAAKRSAPGDLGSATERVSELIRARKLTDAAAIVVRLTESLPGEAAAELARSAGEACRRAAEDDLATICFTSAVLAFPPCEPACRQLAEMALAWREPRRAPSRASLYAPARIDLEEEERDPRLAPIWLEFLARVMRVRCADGDALMVYRQLLALAPGREDVRAIVDVASLTGSLPG
ncbi:MAG: hypothetical protein ACYCUD_11070 [Candidatus Dormibacteria bacterium]